MAYSKIIHTKSEVVGSIPAQGSLSYGEIAINYSDGNLYIKKADNTIRKVASAEFPGQISSLLTDVKSITNSIDFLNLQFISASDLIFGRGNTNTSRINDSLTYGLSNVIGTDTTEASTFGILNSAEGDYGIAIGHSNIAAGDYSIAIGSNVRTPTDVVEFGKWTNQGVRTSSIRCADQNVSFTLKSSSTSILDGGSIQGEEEAAKLPHNMFAVRRNGNEVLLDVNIDGTVKTCSFGTATRTEITSGERANDIESTGSPIQNDRADTENPVTSVRHLTQLEYDDLVTNVSTNPTTIYIVNN